MVIVSFDHNAVTPAGSPIIVSIPVAPLVVCMMEVKSLSMHKVGEEEAILTVSSVEIVRVPIALTLPHPPNKAIS